MSSFIKLHCHKKVIQKLQILHFMHVQASSADGRKALQVFIYARI